MKRQNKPESLLLGGFNSGQATPMTETDWANIRTKIQARIEQKQK